MRGNAGLMWSSGSAKALPLPAGCSARGIATVRHDIVELDESNIQTLRPAPQIRDAHGARIDPAYARLDVLVGQQRVVNAVALEVAIAHDFRPAQYFGVEGERAVHVLNRETEVLHARSRAPSGASFGFSRACADAGNAPEIEPPATAIAAAPAALMTWRRSISNELSVRLSRLISVPPKQVCVVVARRGTFVIAPENCRQSTVC